MIKLKMHSLYDHFPEHNPVEGERYLECYSDMYVRECKGPGMNIALLLEPRSMINEAYEYVWQHPDYFKAIFTHDSELLKLPQAHMLNWADVWLTTDSVKNKGISLCTSYKDWCPLHRIRLELANYYKDKDSVDVFFGDWNNPEVPNVPPEDYLEHYMYSIIIENDLDDDWFTEKILNCFSTKTVPIYWGARKINYYFNPEGIIRIKDASFIPSIVRTLSMNLCRNDYKDRARAIEDNFKRVEPYKTPWKERFFRDYETLLEDILDGTRTDTPIYVVPVEHRGN
jgi:hypothetical protein